MAFGFVIRRNQYYDSVFLMGINRRLLDSPGVRQSAVLMGSEANKAILSSLGIHDPQIDRAEANDLIAAAVADGPEAVADALGKLDEYLQGSMPAASSANPHTLMEGRALRPEANLAVISVPGEYAAAEARKALEAGMHVFLFSSNIPGRDELALKQLAVHKGLLVMGPDCGTALIGGIGLGFSNVVRSGPIGVIGAAGTGLQEFTSQVHNANSGISHAIGTGGHDLSDEIGGLTAFAALSALERDARTKVIVVLSKPPGPRTLERMTERLKEGKKPVVACFLGVGASLAGLEGPGFHVAATIDQAVRLALEAAGLPPGSNQAALPAEELAWARREQESWGKEQKYLRGLFAGGTLCYQAQQILRDAGLRVYSNAPLDGKLRLADSNQSVEHTIMDMGAEEYTLGRPHPMIDGTLRKERLLTEASDPQTAILLLDFVLGYNASMDPVGDLLDAILDAKQASKKGGRVLTVVASVCGTQTDLQDLGAQTRMLREAGVIAFQSAARAAHFCAAMLSAPEGTHGLPNR